MAVLQQQLQVQGDQLQVANDQLQNLEGVNSNLGVVQDQLAAQQQLAAAVQSGRQLNLSELDSSIHLLRVADEELVLGYLDVDLDALAAALPSQASAYVLAAGYSLAASDYYYARGYIELAYSIAVSAREAGSVVVPQR